MKKDNFLKLGKPLASERRASRWKNIQKKIISTDKVKSEDNRYHQYKTILFKE